MERRVSKGIQTLVKDPANFMQKVSRIVRPMKKYYRERFNMTLKDWMTYHHRSIKFDRCHWMGVRTVKNPLDCWVYQEILYEVQPDILIEIGSYEGGSTLYFAHLLDLIGKGNILSIDINRSRFNVKHDRIIEITGDSSSSEVLSQVSGYCKNKSVLVIHDGAHDKNQVFKDLEAYSGFVSLNSYLIVEDGVIDLFSPGDGLGLYEEGPIPAIEEFLNKHPNFMIDLERELYILTCSPQGFLKRVR